MNYNQGGFAPMGYNNGPPNMGYNNGPPPNNTFYSNQVEDFDNIDLDLSNLNPNAEPWEIAHQLTGGERDIGSSNQLRGAFDQAQNMQSSLDVNSARSMFQEANTTSRGGGTSFSTKLIAGAAGWAAMSYYQSYQKKQGNTVNHAFLKKMVAGIAMAQAIKMYNNQSSGGGSFMGMGGRKEIGASREVVAAEAAANAMKLVDDHYGSSGGDMGGQYNQPGYGNQPSMGGGNYNSNNGYGGGNYSSNNDYGGGNYSSNNDYGGYSNPNQGGYSQPGYGNGPQNNFGPQGGYPNSGPGQFNQSGGPPPYNPGPGGFVNPNMPKY